jgi:hypothetical protein
MPVTRPLPTVIGPTENALRALLNRTLSSTRIGGYPAWVVANAASDQDASWREGAAASLRIEPEDLAEIVGELREAGLMDQDGLTQSGAVQLAEARSAVAAAAAHLVDGISDGDQDVARSVLDRIRGRAEELLKLTP